MKPIQSLYAVISIVMAGEPIVDFICKQSEIITAGSILAFSATLIFAISRANKEQDR